MLDGGRSPEVACRDEGHRPLSCCPYRCCDHRQARRCPGNAVCDWNGLHPRYRRTPCWCDGPGRRSFGIRPCPLRASSPDPTQRFIAAAATPASPRTRRGCADCAAPARVEGVTFVQFARPVRCGCGRGRRGARVGGDAAGAAAAGTRDLMTRLQPAPLRLPLSRWPPTSFRGFPFPGTSEDATTRVCDAGPRAPSFSGIRLWTLTRSERAPIVRRRQTRPWFQVGHRGGGQRAAEVGAASLDVDASATVPYARGQTPRCQGRTGGAPRLFHPLFGRSLRRCATWDASGARRVSAPIRASALGAAPLTTLRAGGRAALPGAP